jgi:hypothetical protein
MASRQQYSKSSHPAGPRDKSKYNNHTDKKRNQSQNSGYRQQQNDSAPQISQQELCDFLTEKLRANKFVEVTTNEISNDRGSLYEIDVKNHGLFRIGNGTFYSMKLHTVSHKSRIIFIRIIFNDDDTRNADMKVNVDAIIAIFRELAPDTIDSVSIEDVDDSKGGKHLAVLASTVKGASLNFTYERALQFVHVVDEKYGTPSETIDSATASATDLTTDQIDAEEALLEKKLKALQELKRTKQTANTSNVTHSSSYASAAATASINSIPEEVTEEHPTSRPSSPTKITIKVGDKTINVNRKKKD